MEQGDNISTEEAGEIRELLNENLKLEKENNRILHKMRHWARVSFWLKVVIWCVILSIPFLLYSYLSPLVKEVPGIQSLTSTTSTSIFGLPSPTAVQSFVNSKIQQIQQPQQQSQQ